MSQETTVFKSGNSFAVRLIGDCKLPLGARITERRDGNRIILEPIKESWSELFLQISGSLDVPLERPAQNEVARDPFA